LKFFNADINIRGEIKSKTPAFYFFPGGCMRNLVLILIVFIAVITFFRVFGESTDGMPGARAEAVNSSVNY
jgi:hypothetical protein